MEKNIYVSAFPTIEIVEISVATPFDPYSVDIDIKSKEQMVKLISDLKNCAAQLGWEV